METYKRIEAKIDKILAAVHGKDLRKKYLTAKDVSLITGLDSRTILNRSNLHPADRRYIPSTSLGTQRKYFERKVIMRVFKLEDK